MMSEKKLLNFAFSTEQKDPNLPVLVFIHGLFGDLNNLGVIARAFSDQYPILRIDLRNHGQSFHSNDMNYDCLSEDVINLLDHLKIQNAVLIGHSMGGKTAMMVAGKRPDLVSKLVVIDIAPVNYGEHGHREIFKGLKAVAAAQVTTRQEAKQILAQYIQNDAVQQFMLKSFDAQSPQRFRFNVNVLEDNYLAIMDWQEVLFSKPTLFIKGNDSDYILPQYQAAILRQFPHAKAFVVQGSGHWVHAEKTQSVIRAITQFLTVNKS